MTKIITIAAACIIDPLNRLLVVRKQGSEIFMQPGGKIELNEKPIEALVREIKEELLLAIDLSLPKYIGQFEAPAANEPGYIVKAELFKIDLPYSPELTVAAEIAEAKWLTEKEITTINMAPLMHTYVIPLWIK
ncbi:NUDIX domain-containing protein [Entomomonas moraniae]|uniref:NUDIX domain-containing protein n=1 Tax=Entomomonas moraniae TaxID=2213226 RepID=A0A3Q9JKF2_9GAMM|nr:NUDIX domain-containing protein [Entomomonas moraniae]AZS51658.1 NUDIX domain-containing protein [Entomomonas moraniae]